MHLCVYYDGYNFANRSKFNKQIPGLSDYTLCNIYSTESNLQFFKNLNSIVNSTVNMRVSTTNGHPGYYYKIKKEK